MDLFGLRSLSADARSLITRLIDEPKRLAEQKESTTKYEDKETSKNEVGYRDFIIGKTTDSYVANVCGQPFVDNILRYNCYNDNDYFLNLALMIKTYFTLSKSMWVH